MTVGRRTTLRRFAHWANLGAKVVLLGTLAVLFEMFGYWCIQDGRHGLHEADAVAARGRTVPGTVLATKRDSGPHSAGTRWVRVRYRTPEGTYEYWQGGTEDVGDVVHVHYVPGHPETATIRSQTYNRAGDVGVIAIGVGAMLVPLMLGAAAAKGARDDRRAHRPRASTAS
jgi:hypothetical protein